MAWTDRWLNLRYEAHGRGPKSYDCLGLFLAVQKAEFGRELDYGVVDIGPAEEMLRAEREGEWIPVKVAREGSAVLMRRGRGWHIGTAIDDSRMLHCDAPCGGSVIEFFNSRKWGGRLEGIYEYVG